MSPPTIVAPFLTYNEYFSFSIRGLVKKSFNLPWLNALFSEPDIPIIALWASKDPVRDKSPLICWSPSISTVIVPSNVFLAKRISFVVSSYTNTGDLGRGLSLNEFASNFIPPEVINCPLPEMSKIPLCLVLLLLNITLGLLAPPSPGLNIMGPSGSLGGNGGLPPPVSPSSVILVPITSVPSVDAIILLNTLKEDVSNLPEVVGPAVSLLVFCTTMGCGRVAGGNKPYINPLALTLLEAVMGDSILRLSVLITISWGDVVSVWVPVELTVMLAISDSSNGWDNHVRVPNDSPLVILGSFLWNFNEGGVFDLINKGREEVNSPDTSFQSLSAPPPTPNPNEFDEV